MVILCKVFSAKATECKLMAADKSLEEERRKFLTSNTLKTIITGLPKELERP